jgi:hypothetical protein
VSSESALEGGTMHAAESGGRSWPGALSSSSNPTSHEWVSDVHYMMSCREGHVDLDPEYIDRSGQIYSKIKETLHHHGRRRPMCPICGISARWRMYIYRDAVRRSAGNTSKRTRADVR